MDTTLQDRVLLRYGDLERLGMLEPSTQKIIRLERVHELLPPGLVRVAGEGLERCAYIVFRLRIMARTTSDLVFTTELTDVLYHLAGNADGRAPEADEAGERLGIGRLGVFLALALYAKRLMLEHERPMIEYQGQTVRCLLERWERIPLLAGLPEHAPETASA
ncbi:hypothetical protein HY478_00605 [Candidatus Uhrbacteria bacterium]|nr:hypothetical protein [Candidatus Uhrbacteria bacterium]